MLSKGGVKEDNIVSVVVIIQPNWSIAQQAACITKLHNSLSGLGSPSRLFDCVLEASLTGRDEV